MSTFVFKEPGGINPLVRNEIAKLRSLADDLERLANGEAPTVADLDGSPLLSAYYTSRRTVQCLIGRVEGHPIISDKMVTTSDLWAIAPQHGWARTYSRWYRLGESEAELAARHGTTGGQQ